MTLKDLLSRTNNFVKWRLTDRFTRQNIDIRENQKETLNRNIYMIFQDDDGTLNISLF